MAFLEFNYIRTWTSKDILSNIKIVPYNHNYLLLKAFTQIK